MYASFLRLSLLCFLLLSVVDMQATDYASQRLDSIARLLNIAAKLDGLAEGTYDSIATHRSHAVTIRVNAWGEVEHIGYKVFADDIRQVQPSPVYDFLERYALEWQLSEGTDRQVLLALEKIVFVTGSVETMLTLKGDEEFIIESIKTRMYRTTWKREGNTVLSATFDMDWQLMTGCNSIELENRLLEYMQRHQQVMPPSTEFGNPQEMPDDGDVWSYNAGEFIGQEIRHERYYIRENGEWQLVCSANDRRQTIYNTLLAMQMPGNPTVKIILDKFGYKTDSIEIPWKQALSYFLHEGCKTYLGVKYIRENEYQCTLFMPNETGGYLHMLSVKIKNDQIGNPDLAFTGRLYAYIPIHNIAKDYFNTRKQ